MLVLSRREGERLFLDCDGVSVIITLTEFDRDKVRIGIDAPEIVQVFREEVYLDRYGPELTKKFVKQAVKK